MANKIYVVDLTDEEREFLLNFISHGTQSVRKTKRAHILLLADEGQTDGDIAKALHTSESTVQRTRRRFVVGNLDRALNEDPRPGASKKLDEKGEALLTVLAQSEPPEGRKRWTLQLLADRLVELKVVNSISCETVRQELHKKGIKPWRRTKWVIPNVGAEFVWRMEDVLAVYARPYDPKRPQVCFDEMLVQLIAETREPLPSKPGQPKRFDYEYKRNGTRNLFVFFQPLAGQRHILITEHRTKTDYAYAMRYLVDELYPDAEKIVLVQDNLNTHTPAALYETFEPAEARRILERLELHYTPKHGSWLNIVEIELSILSEQCLDDRIPDGEALQRRVQSWEAARNEKRATVNWQFGVSDARAKLERLYPNLSESS